MTLRSTLARSSTLRALFHRSAPVREKIAQQFWDRVMFDRLPVRTAVRLTYELMLEREPDAGGWADYVDRLERGVLTRAEVPQFFRGSEEFANLAFGPSTLGPAIHAGRCQFIRSLPPARRIVDLGGTHLARPEGALVALGYPYFFDELFIVDLPSDDRHPLYQGSAKLTEVQTSQGMVRYRYHSMADLSDFDDESVDLVYAGQSIEHVSPAECAGVLAHVLRILRPGGHLALDTPNGRLTRLQQDEFIDPDHKVEYTWPELASLLRDAGFEIARAQGLNWGGASAAAGRFDAGEAARHWGLHDAIEDSYILCAICRKPLA